MKHVPNLLSALRILLSPVLIATADRPPLLAALMLLAGATDAVDGIIARRFDCQTRLGARLDSVADWTFFLALGWVFCTRYESVVRSFLTELVVVLALRLAAIVVGWLRFRRLLSVHTLGNKISAVIAFVLLVRIVWCGPVSATALRIALLFAALAALEELLIIVRSRTPDPNPRDQARTRHRGDKRGAGRRRQEMHRAPLPPAGLRLFRLLLLRFTLPFPAHAAPISVAPCASGSAS